MVLEVISSPIVQIYINLVYIFVFYILGTLLYIPTYILIFK